MRKLTFVVALIFALATAIFVAGSDVKARDEGNYNCCGNSSCDDLKARQACPSGDDDCSSTGATHCCGDNPGEASCYMKVE